MHKRTCTGAAFVSPPATRVTPVQLRLLCHGWLTPAALDVARRVFGASARLQCPHARAQERRASARRGSRWRTCKGATATAEETVAGALAHATAIAFVKPRGARSRSCCKNQTGQVEKSLTRLVPGSAGVAVDVSPTGQDWPNCHNNASALLRRDCADKRGLGDVSAAQRSTWHGDRGIFHQPATSRATGLVRFPPWGSPWPLRL